RIRDWRPASSILTRVAVDLRHPPQCVRHRLAASSRSRLSGSGDANGRAHSGDGSVRSTLRGEEEKMTRLGLWGTAIITCASCPAAGTAPNTNSGAGDGGPGRDAGTVAVGPGGGGPAAACGDQFDYSQMNCPDPASNREVAVKDCLESR